MFGDEITAVALPTVALLVLNASPLQFGLIGASSYLPYPVLGLLAGAWIDRMRRKVVLLIADLVRGAAIASIPVAVLTRTVTLTQLVVVGLIVGTASVFFNSAYQAYLPHIVTSDDLSKANARLSISETASQVAGPTMAGGLISLAGVGGAMFADAVSFLASVISLLFIRRPEPEPERRRGSLIPDVSQGLRLVIRNRLLLGLTLTSAVSNLGRGMALELVVFFAFKGLHLSPALVGVMMAAGNAGPFLGSLVSQRFTTRFGLGPALLIGSVMKGLPWVFMPLALLGGGVPVVITVMVVSGFFIPISNVTTLTIRQTLVTSDMQGRVAATVRTVTRTVVPLATILGGVLAQVGTRLLGPRAGLTAVLALGGLIWLSAGLLLPRRVLRQVHSIDDLEGAVPAATEGSRRGGGRGRAGSGRRAGARRALQQSLLLGQEPPPWAEELYRPMRMTGPVMMPGYGSRAHQETYARPAGPPPAGPRPASPRPASPRPASPRPAGPRPGQAAARLPAASRPVAHQAAARLPAASRPVAHQAAARLPAASRPARAPPARWRNPAERASLPPRNPPAATPPVAIRPAASRPAISPPPRSQPTQAKRGPLLTTAQ